MSSQTSHPTQPPKTPMSIQMGGTPIPKKHQCQLNSQSRTSHLVSHASYPRVSYLHASHPVSSCLASRISRLVPSCLITSCFATCTSYAVTHNHLAPHNLLLRNSYLASDLFPTPLCLFSFFLSH
ncbi:hypothetical protein BS47DRAFT_1400961 [Hydnum rufescens UP504]|uniref:Uncharacterized protein n=1 Tax=Hydnum rufescens UP504 TaxID=1448309 RepID=A0A9P6AGK1_9AGAM|nr:hypothetical protein BS47DRAFT_1400961 [Hydnum rufescens UP504]